MRLAAAVAVACLAARAHADPLPFMRHDGDSFVDVRAAYAASIEESTAITKALDLTVHYLVSKDAGVYGEFGGARTIVTDVETGVEYRGATPLDLELGGFERIRSDDNASAITLTAGVSLPTILADEGGAGYTEHAEPTDAARTLDHASARGGFTASYRRGVILAAHFGVDVSPGAADVFRADFAAALGGETDTGTSIVFAVGGYHTFSDRPFQHHNTVDLALELAQRIGRASVWLGGRAGASQYFDGGASITAGVRVAL